MNCTATFLDAQRSIYRGKVLQYSSNTVKHVCYEARESSNIDLDLVPNYREIVHNVTVSFLPKAQALEGVLPVQECWGRRGRGPT